ncbi:hypothetical protein GCM10010398_14320 [Streptomyces fimbriatus]
MFLVGAEDEVGAGFQEGGHLLTWWVVEQISGGGGRAAGRRRKGAGVARAGRRCGVLTRA